MYIEGEQTYFSAEEARKVTDKVNSEQVNEEIQWIYRLINEARFKGEYSIIIHSNKELLKSTENFLRDKGFTIFVIGDNNFEANITISWSSI